MVVPPKRVTVLFARCSQLSNVSFAHVAGMASLPLSRRSDVVLVIPDLDLHAHTGLSASLLTACLHHPSRALILAPQRALAHLYSNGLVPSICRAISYRAACDFLNVTSLPPPAPQPAPTTESDTIDLLLPLAWRAAVLVALCRAFPFASVSVAVPSVTHPSFTSSPAAEGEQSRALRVLEPSIPPSGVVAAAHLASTHIPLSLTPSLDGSHDLAPAPSPIYVEEVCVTAPWPLCGAPPLSALPAAVKAAVRRMHSGGAATLSEFKAAGADLSRDGAAQFLMAVADVCDAWEGDGEAEGDGVGLEGRPPVCDVGGGGTARAVGSGSHSRVPYDVSLSASVSSALRSPGGAVEGVGGHTPANVPAALRSIVELYKHAHINTGDVKGVAAQVACEVGQWYRSRIGVGGGESVGDRSDVVAAVEKALYGVV